MQYSLVSAPNEPSQHGLIGRVATRHAIAATAIDIAGDNQPNQLIRFLPSANPSIVRFALDCSAETTSRILEALGIYGWVYKVIRAIVSYDTSTASLEISYELHLP